MKRVIDIAKWVGIALVGFVVGLLILGNIDLGNGEEPQKKYSTVRSVVIAGESMEPTLSVGQTVLADFAKEPKVGDIVYFDCIKVCMDPEDTESVSHLVKRIKEIDSNGRWFIVGDNQPESWDSYDHGWILPSERASIGVVTEIIK